MKENLVKILTAIYSKEGDLGKTARAIFCPDIITNSSTSDCLAFLNEPDFTASFKTFSNFVKYNNNLSNLSGYRFLNDNEKDEIKNSENIFQSIEKICNEKGIILPKDFTQISKSLTNSYSKTANLLALLLMIKASSNEKNSSLSKLISSIIIELEEKGAVDINKKNVLKIIKNSYPTLFEKSKDILRQYSMLTELSFTPNQSCYIKSSVLNRINQMQYIDENGNDKNLFSDYKDLDQNISIEDAIKNFDIKDNSNLIRYALLQIEKKVQSLNLFTEQEIQPATEIILLTLCDQYDKEVDDNLLFAFTNPIYESINTSSVHFALDDVKEIVKEISGIEVKYAFNEYNKKELSENENELKEQEENLEAKEKKLENNDNEDNIKNENTNIVLKNPKYLKPAEIWDCATTVLAGHCVYIPTEYANKGKATAEQVNIVTELIGRSMQTREKIIAEIKSKRSKIKKISSNSSVNEMMANLIKVVKDIIGNLKSIKSELNELKNQYKKEIDKDKKFEISSKFNDKKEEYETIKNYLFDILKPLIRDRVFKGIDEFDSTDYASDAENDGL